MEKDKLLTVSLLGFATVCLALISVANADLGGLQMLCPMGLAILSGNQFIKQIRKL